MQDAKQKQRRASTGEEKKVQAPESHRLALQRFADFVAKGIEPKDFLQNEFEDCWYGCQGRASSRAKLDSGFHAR
jgi:hypothetical protein